MADREKERRERRAYEELKANVERNKAKERYKAEKARNWTANTREVEKHKENKFNNYKKQ